MGSGSGAGGTFSVTAGDATGAGNNKAASMVTGSPFTTGGESLTLAAGAGNTTGGYATIYVDGGAVLGGSVTIYEVKA